MVSYYIPGIQWIQEQHSTVVYQVPGMQKAPAINTKKRELTQPGHYWAPCLPSNFLFIVRKRASLSYDLISWHRVPSIRVYVRVHTEDENKTKYDMHDGYDKIPTWLDLVRPGSKQENNFAKCWSNRHSSCCKLQTIVRGQGRYFVAAVMHVQPAGNCR